MPKTLKQWIVPLIIFIIAAIVPENEPNMSGSEMLVVRIFIGIGFGLGGLFFQSLVHFFVLTATTRDVGFLRGKKKFLSIILMLTAKLTQADGKVDSKEKELIAKRLAQEFNAEDVQRYLQEFDSYLEANVSIKQIGKIIAYNFDDAAKSQLMFLLIRLATIDGLLSKSELEVIQKIAKHGRIRTSLYLHIFKAFEFKREQAYKEKSKQSRRQNSRPNQSALKAAYGLLEIAENASADAIKRAYRKLAKKHHPDKVAHLGESHQHSAKKKFQLIADAYELIKKNRGI